jgi:hypothetical protein
MLTTLKGAPKKINGSFECYNNRLTNLVGAPEEIKYSFVCGGNPLESLEGCPKFVGKDFHITKAGGGRFTKEDIRKVCDVGGDIVLY